MKSIKIAEVCQQSEMMAMVVQEDMLLTDAVEQFATNHHVRGIFLTDENGRLTGVLNKHDLLLWLRLQIGQEAHREKPSLSRMRRLLHAQHVSDLLTPGSENTAVRLDETVADALDKMTQYKLGDIPVIDEDGIIVNDLRLSEILNFMLHYNA